MGPPSQEGRNVQLISKQAMADTARSLATSYELVLNNNTLYVPAHCDTLEPGPTDPEHQIWRPMSRKNKRQMANRVGGVLFANDSEITNFDLMLQQFSTEVDETVSRMLIRTEDGLRLLNTMGELEVPSGSFTPNFVRYELNANQADQDEVKAALVEWLDNEDEAYSMLRHLSTILSPGWSAVKYLLFLGEGRNGKSVLLHMLNDLFGAENVSHITRQQMAEHMPVCAELNNKLLNLVFDGKMTYVKDSAMEKTLIAGEPGYVRMLYENGTTEVLTKALFIEALQEEPKSRDKSSALQKRLVRFWFPKIYELDHKFERHMRSKKMLGALLALLIENFVHEDEVAEKLAPSKGARVMQIQQQLVNSPIMQFLEWLAQSDPEWIDRLTAGGQKLETLSASFMAWRLAEGFGEYNSTDVKKMLRSAFHVTRKSVRESGRVTKQEILGEPKPDTQLMLNSFKEDVDVQSGSLVED